MSREINLSGGDISVIKALGLSGSQVTGQSLLSRLPYMEPVELIDTMDTLLMFDYVQCDMDRVRSADDFKAAKYNVNTAMLRDLRDAVTPQKKEVKPTRQRRG